MPTNYNNTRYAKGHPIRVELERREAEASDKVRNCSTCRWFDHKNTNCRAFRDIDIPSVPLLVALDRCHNEISTYKFWEAKR